MADGAPFRFRADVRDFINRLQKADAAEQVEITEREVQTLKGRLSLPTLKVYLSLRRTAVLQVFGAAHPAYDMLRLDDSAYEQLRENYQAAVSSRQTHPVRLTHTREMIKTAEALLASDEPTTLILALCLTTGRRSYEIAANPETRFDLIETVVDRGRVREKYHIRFRGQAKTRGAENTMAHKVITIPVLADGAVIIAAFERLRSKVAPSLVGMHYQDFNAAFAVRLNRRCKAIFGAFWPGGEGAGDDEAGKTRGKLKTDVASISTRDLRAIYAEVCSRVFNRTGTPSELMKPSEYMARILGHKETDLATAQSYQTFILEDIEAPASPSPQMKARITVSAPRAGARAAEDKKPGSAVREARKSSAKRKEAAAPPPVTVSHTQVTVPADEASRRGLAKGLGIEAEGLKPGEVVNVAVRPGKRPPTVLPPGSAADAKKKARQQAQRRGTGTAAAAQPELPSSGPKPDMQPSAPFEDYATAPDGRYMVMTDYGQGLGRHDALPEFRDAVDVAKVAWKHPIYSKGLRRVMVWDREAQEGQPSMYEVPKEGEPAPAKAEAGNGSKRTTRGKRRGKE